MMKATQAKESRMTMEFYEKLQALRKQKGITQEELAQALYVSRTAVSKWESGRGYPNIDSLKAIAKFYAVSIDELLSGGEALTIAEEEKQLRMKQLCRRVFTLLDLSAGLLFVLPLFAVRADGAAHAVSLLSLHGAAPAMKAAYMAVVLGMVLSGLMTMLAGDNRAPLWQKHGQRVSLLFNAVGALLFVASLQPYAAAVLLIFAAVKAMMLAKRP
jgi:transcriptional regulator with XRE-family HTH domain